MNTLFIDRVDSMFILTGRLRNGKRIKPIWVYSNDSMNIQLGKNYILKFPIKKCSKNIITQHLELQEK